MDDADREAADAPAARKRRALLLLLLLVVPLGVLVLVALPGPSPEPEPVVVVVDAPPAPAPPVIAPPTPSPPPAPVLKPEPTRAVRRARAVAPPVEAVTTTVVIGEALGGDASVRKTALRAFSRSVTRLDVRPRADSGYSVTVHVDEQKERASGSTIEVTVRCGVTIALLPKKNVLASLKTRADVEGEGTPVDELFNDAAEACGQALGKDLTGWVKAHPL